MRTIRGLQVTSLLVLSPVLICLVALVSIIFVPVYSSLVGWCQFAMPQLKVLQLNYSSIITWFFALLVSYHYSAVKDYFCQTPDLTAHKEPVSEPFEAEIVQKKQPKKKKSKKTKQPAQQACKSKKKDKNVLNTIQKEQVYMADEDEDDYSKEEDSKEDEDYDLKREDSKKDEEWIDVKKIKNQTCITKDKEIKNEEKSLMITPDITPNQSEDETGTVKVKGWYSPFSTGLDLDILPKFTVDPLCQYKINFTPPPSPLIPNILQQKHQHPSSPKQSIIELLENYPFISTNHHHHHQHSLGPIGENKAKFAPK